MHRRSSISVSEAHEILGVSQQATEEEVRRAYLALVRENPPDRDADKFRQIHEAYKMMSDPLVLARAQLQLAPVPPDLAACIAAAEQTYPRLPKLALLALGNQEGSA